MNYRNAASRTRDLETLAVLSLFFLALASFTHRDYPMYVAMALLVIALFIRPAAAIITKRWLAGAALLGRLNSMIILTIVFYLILTPLSFVYRLFNRDPLGILPQKKTGSLFTVREHTFVKEDLEKMW